MSLLDVWTIFFSLQLEGHRKGECKIGGAKKLWPWSGSTPNVFPYPLMTSSTLFLIDCGAECELRLYQFNKKLFTTWQTTYFGSRYVSSLFYGGRKVMFSIVLRIYQLVLSFPSYFAFRTKMLQKFYKGKNSYCCYQIISPYPIV